MPRLEIYADNAATTQVTEDVREFIQPYLEEEYGNPSSPHEMGTDVQKAIEKARLNVTKMIGADEDEDCVIFTSGGTESNNWALRARCGRIITSAIEHRSVLETAQNIGCAVTVLPVDQDGLIDPDSLREALTIGDVSMVSIQLANNEIGTIQPIEDLVKITKEYDEKILFHTDAVQALGKIRFDVQTMNVDLLSISGHKIHGPKGSGALYIKPGVGIEPMIYGGDHEFETRAGTQNVIGIIGLGRALEIAWKEGIEKSYDKQFTMVEKMIMDLSDSYPDAKRNGHTQKRLPNILNVTIPGVDCHELVSELDRMYGIFISCGSGSKEPSHVIKAIGGVSDPLGSIRISISRYTTQNHCNKIVRAIPIAIAQCRRKML